MATARPRARFIPSPLGMEFQPWGALFAESFADLGVSAPSTDEKWQDWASSLLNFPQLVAVPNPYGFEHWNDWAVRTLETSIY